MPSAGSRCLADASLSSRAAAKLDSTASYCLSTSPWAVMSASMLVLVAAGRFHNERARGAATGQAQGRPRRGSNKSAVPDSPEAWWATDDAAACAMAAAASRLAPAPSSNVSPPWPEAMSPVGTSYCKGDDASQLPNIVLGKALARRLHRNELIKQRMGGLVAVASDGKGAGLWLWSPPGGFLLRLHKLTTLHCA